jgi:hypothetical protein
VNDLCAHIEGRAPSADTVRAATRAAFDGSRGYLLGLVPDALDRLLVRAVTETA